MAKNIKKNQSDAVQLHTEILQIAEENKNIIDHADDYRERWQTVFPDGMLEDLCVEFCCCPSLVFITLEILCEETSSIVSPITKKLIEYQGIYSIQHSNHVYVGETQDSFKTRWQKHKQDSRRNTTKCLYQYVNEVSSWNAMLFRIEKILPSEADFLEEERKYIQKYKEQNAILLNYVRPNWNQQLSSYQVDKIIDLLIKGYSNQYISEKLGISSPHISNIRSGKKNRKDNIIYPILSRADKKQIGQTLLICSLLNDISLSFSEITRRVQCHPNKVSKIYHGEFPKAFTNKYAIPEAFSSREKPKIQKCRKLPKHHSKKPKVEIICPQCGRVFVAYEEQKFCSRSCSNIGQRKNNRPSRNELKRLIRNKSFTAIANIFNVTDNAIRRWCKYYQLPTSSYDIRRYSDEEWSNEIWNNNDQIEHFSTRDKLLLFLLVRNYYFTRDSHILDNEIHYVLEKYHLCLHTIDWTRTTCHLKEHNLYFRSAEDAGKWLLQNTQSEYETHTYLSKKIAKALKNVTTATLTLPDPTTGSPTTLTFAHVPEDEFYEVIQHHHVVSYAFDPKWASIVEDPSVLPDFISLDELPWVEEFKEFYGMG